MNKNVCVKNFVMTIDNMLNPKICDFIVEHMQNLEKHYKSHATSL